MSHDTEECRFETQRQWLATAPAALVGQYDAPFRLADEGEPVTAAWFEQIACRTHGSMVLLWHPVEPDQIDAAQHAIDLGCEVGCHCRCHDGSNHD